MGGRINRAFGKLSLKSKRDCARIASDLNYDVDEVEFWHQQIALEIEFTLGWPRSVAEWSATRVTKEALDCRGRAAS